MLCYKRRESVQCSESSPAPPCGLTPDALLQNIDTDQIIPAEYLTLVPSKRDEYEKLGSYALIGLPTELYPERWPSCHMEVLYKCYELSAGAKMVVAESYARIFFRNCVSTGEIYPVETPERLCDTFKTGQELEVDLDNSIITDIASGKTYPLKPIGE
eukprot:jgi/Astpho2/5356/Aster-05901